MKPEELRIGNLVNDPYNDPTNVDFNILHYIAICELNKQIQGKYTPIPLTEEWLLKFEFENWGEVIVNEYEKYQRFVLHNVIDGTSNFEVHIIKSNYGKIKHTAIEYSIGNDERQTVHCTEFVHNLQNSFYLSSGNELTIK